jgi:predicted metalloprotease
VPRRSASPLAVATAAALAVALAGCAQVVPGRAAPVAGAGAVAPPAAVAARSGDPATITAQLQDFWRVRFPAEFDRPWHDIRAFVGVHARDRTPPCVDRASDVADQAYYCPPADAVVWDADGLIPDVRRVAGAPGVVVVLAHEVGHAVQSRLGVDDLQTAHPADYPTILLEAMADCYAGVAAEGLGLDAGERDRAVGSLADFRDPLGVEPGDTDAHGNAFDRVASFQDGFDGGAHRCADMTLANHPFTLRAFGSAADAANGGDLPLPALLDGLGTDARGWYTSMTGRPGPPLADRSTCAGWADQGPAAFCGTDPAVVVDRERLDAVSTDIGDYAAGTLVAARYGLAVLAALGRPVTGREAGDNAICLAGAYTARLVDPSGKFTLSPGDLDEAVAVLLADDWAARDATGSVDPAERGYDRVDAFRSGVVGGSRACLGG